jgi:hypothetical protein
MTSYGSTLAAFGRLLQARLETERDEVAVVEPRNRLLPLTAALLNGRRAVDVGAYGVGVQQFASVGLHLAFLASEDGEPELRLLDFARLQRQRHDIHHGRQPAWHELDRRACFDRALANAVSVAYEIDREARRWDRIAKQAADCANYLLYYFVLSGLELEEWMEWTEPEGGAAA